MVGFNFDIPNRLHKKFKIKSIQEEQDMSQILINLISIYVRQKKEK